MSEASSALRYRPDGEYGAGESTFERFATASFGWQTLAMTESPESSVRFAHLDGVAADEAVTAAHHSYRQQRPRSAKQAEVAGRVLPGGSTRSVLDIDPFPFRVASADGAQLVDVDGLTYTDFLGDYTAALLGHNPPAIRRAVVDALDRGWSLGALSNAEHELAELLCQRFPSVDQIRFTNSGTEANLMAISLARHQTGRQKVLVFDGGYHGGLLHFGPGGSPLQAPFDYVRCRYNDLGSVAAALNEHGPQIACAVVEPMLGAGGCIPARSDFLMLLLRRCRAAGVLVVFDEVMTSRMSAGGAQERLGLDPDLTTLGKYLAGGMTFGAFGGSADLMSAFDPARGGTLTHGGTFNNNVVTMSAGIAACAQLLDADRLDRLFDDGEAFRARLNEQLAPLSMMATGWGSMLTIHGALGPIAAPHDLAGVDARVGELLFHRLLDRGYYIARRGFVSLSLAVTAEQRAGFVDALAEALSSLTADGILIPLRGE